MRYGHLLRLQDGNILVVADAVGHCSFCEIDYEHFEHIWMWCLNSQLDSLWTQHYRFAADTFLESTPRAVQAENGDIFVTSAIHTAETDYLNTNAAIWRLNSREI
ncbi:MAG: hypothetical protein IPP40_08650 [bacterium]|nr:hypothetical protein [bacterium]